MVIVFCISALSLSVPIFVNDGRMILVGFIIFEAMVGMFWPSVGMLRSKYIPENVRSTVMNYFRIPTNLFVMLVLGRVNEMTHTQVFSICVFLLFICVAVQCYLAYDQFKHQKTEDDDQEQEETTIPQPENVSDEI